MKASEIIEYLGSRIPLKLAQSWDNVGLIVGDRTTQVKKVLLAIDVTRDVVAEAKRYDCQMIISYHPVIWDGLKRVIPDGEGAVVYDLVRAGIVVYSIHTALDVVNGGVNDVLAEIVGIKEGQPIGDYVPSPEGINYKLVVFVPVGDVHKVADAIFDAGAGWIGNYSRCSFRSFGKGTFLPMEGAKPAIGRKGRLEEVDEVRFECIVPENKLEAVIAAMKDAHPYEEPAFDVFKLSNPQSKFGLGRIGLLDKPAKVNEIINRLKRYTSAKAVGIVGKTNLLVKKAAVCAGSCGKIINAVISAGAQLYVTGELKHHYALLAQQAGLVCLCLTHTVSERFILKRLADSLLKDLKMIKVIISKTDRDPFDWKQI